MSIDFRRLTVKELEIPSPSEVPTPKG